MDSKVVPLMRCLNVSGVVWVNSKWKWLFVELQAKVAVIIRNLMNFDKVVDKIGVDNIEKAINGTDATEGLRLIREAMFGK